MKRPEGSPCLYLASSQSDQALPPGSDSSLRSVLATLEDCRATLAIGNEHETADVLSMAILQLRMKLEGVSDSELRLLCDTLAEEVRLIDVPRRPKRTRARRRRRAPALLLVKSDNV